MREEGKETQMVREQARDLEQAAALFLVPGLYVWVTFWLTHTRPFLHALLPSSRTPFLLHSLIQRDFF